MNPYLKIAYSIHNGTITFFAKCENFSKKCENFAKKIKAKIWIEKTCNAELSEQRIPQVFICN